VYAPEVGRALLLEDSDPADVLPMMETVAGALLAAGGPDSSALVLARLGRLASTGR